MFWFTDMKQMVINIAQIYNKISTWFYIFWTTPYISYTNLYAENLEERWIQKAANFRHVFHSGIKNAQFYRGPKLRYSIDFPAARTLMRVWQFSQFAYPIPRKATNVFPEKSKTCRSLGKAFMLRFRERNGFRISWFIGETVSLLKIILKLLTSILFTPLPPLPSPKRK